MTALETTPKASEINLLKCLKKKILLQLSPGKNECYAIRTWAAWGHRPTRRDDASMLDTAGANLLSRIGLSSSWPRQPSTLKKQQEIRQVLRWPPTFSAAGNLRNDIVSKIVHWVSRLVPSSVRLKAEQLSFMSLSRMLENNFPLWPVQAALMHSQKWGIDF